MANHQPIKDPFAKIALFGGLAIILLTVGILVKFLISTIQNNSIDGEIDTAALVANKTAMTAANLKPIGEVTSSDGSGAAPSAARSGEEVYNAVCTACHASGAAGAPKLDDKAAWEPRIATGFDALMNTAINGKGAMPARGGQNVPDGELKAAIAYMTTKAGFSLDIPKDEAAAAPAEEKKAQETPKEEATAAPAEGTPKVEAPATVEKAAPTPAAATPEVEKAAPTPAAAAPETEKTAPSPEAAPTTPASPPTPEAPNAVEAPEAPKAPETATPEAAAKTAAAVTAVVAAATTAAPEASAEPAAKESSTSIDGEAIYKKTCFACHDMGIAGAPKLGDKALWEPRIATGKDALYNSAIKGKTSPAGAMPPKGGNMTLTDDEIKATVDYMVSKSQ